MQQVPVSEQRRRLQALDPGVDAAPFFTAGTATGTTTLTLQTSPLPSHYPIFPGMRVSGFGVNPATIVVSYDGDVTVILSLPATTAGAEILGFGAPSRIFYDVNLFTAFAGGLDPSPADFTEATFDDYDTVEPAQLIGPVTKADGSAELIFPDVAWVLVRDQVAGQSILGYFVTYTDLDTVKRLAFWETFQTPQPMFSAGQAIIMDIPFSLPGPSSATLT